ncbi:hypothetical protein KSP39_PZI011356 [Platanthera zijinensis]|uniref:Uncharacterized protein n=1 Tax=Platanthera zijinensis TaxID=2320716 RepID=A0AAP0BHM2_9ASPA
MEFSQRIMVGMLLLLLLVLLPSTVMGFIVKLVTRSIPMDCNLQYCKVTCLNQLNGLACSLANSNCGTAKTCMCIFSNDFFNSMFNPERCLIGAGSGIFDEYTL